MREVESHAVAPTDSFENGKQIRGGHFSGVRTLLLMSKFS